ncbi:MAG: sigma-70 family RNA polymerase sigma factor [Pirellulales bacterium]
MPRRNGAWCCAGRGDAGGAVALAELCRGYWYPLYAYVRRRTGNPHDAQDLTQAFFAELLEHEKLAAALPERGKFRAFLLTALRNFLVNEHERATAKKRGGDAAVLSLDFADGESRWNLEPYSEETPERIFEREWTLTLLTHVLERLREEHEIAGKSELFAALRGTLDGSSGETSYSEIAAKLGLSNDAARQAAARLRRRYRELLRAEVLRTVAEPADVDAELRGLLENLR